MIHPKVYRCVIVHQCSNNKMHQPAPATTPNAPTPPQHSTLTHRFANGITQCCAQQRRGIHRVRSYVFQYGQRTPFERLSAITVAHDAVQSSQFCTTQTMNHEPPPSSTTTITTTNKGTTTKENKTPFREIPHEPPPSPPPSTTKAPLFPPFPRKQSVVNLYLSSVCLRCVLPSSFSTKTWAAAVNPCRIDRPKALTSSTVTSVALTPINCFAGADTIRPLRPPATTKVQKTRSAFPHVNTSMPRTHGQQVVNKL